MTSAALWRGGIHDLVVEGHPRLARQRGHHDASDTAMVAPGELVETDVQAGIREQVVNDCHGLNVARSIRAFSGSCSLTRRERDARRDTRSILTSARGVFGEEPSTTVVE